MILEASLENSFLRFDTINDACCCFLTLGQPWFREEAGLRPLQEVCFFLEPHHSSPSHHEVESSSHRRTAPPPSRMQEVGSSSRCRTTPPPSCQEEALSDDSVEMWVVAPPPPLRLQVAPPPSLTHVRSRLMTPP
jgi:hypothetical protein